MIDEFKMITGIAQAIISATNDSLQIDRLDIQYNDGTGPQLEGYYGYLKLDNGTEYKIFEDGSTVKIFTGDLG